MRGKVALITGGGKGIGKTTALLFGKNGARVIVCSRSEKELDETVKSVLDAGGSAERFVCDVSDESEVVKTFAAVGEKFGSLDILVNSAGHFSFGLMEETSAGEFRKMLDINCTGMFLCCREACKLMKKRGGAIVNISSLSGIRGVEKFPGFGAYIVSKFGVVGLTEILAVEWKEYGIRVNAIAPGAVDTEMLQKAAPNLNPRLSPEQVAETILFLAGPESSAINGSTIELFAHLQKG